MWLHTEDGGDTFFHGITAQKTTIYISKLIQYL
jgi:hypothetical protein